MKARALFVVLASFAAVASAETVVSNNAGRLAVNFCRDDLVHFRYAPKGVEFVDPETFVARQAIAKTDADYAPAEVREAQPADAEPAALGEESLHAVGVVVVGEGHHREIAARVRELLRLERAVARGAVDMEVYHFFTISVIAERNWFTSVNRRYTDAKRM